MTQEQSIKGLMKIPSVGKSIANDLWNIGIKCIYDLEDKDPVVLYELSNRFAGAVQDRCLLYCFRCAIYYAQTEGKKRKPEKLKWWNWKDLRRQNAKTPTSVLTEHFFNQKNEQ